MAETLYSRMIDDDVGVAALLMTPWVSLGLVKKEMVTAPTKRARPAASPAGRRSQAARCSFLFDNIFLLSLRRRAGKPSASIAKGRITAWSSSAKGSPKESLSTNVPPDRLVVHGFGDKAEEHKARRLCHLP